MVGLGGKCSLGLEIMILQHKLRQHDVQVSLHCRFITKLYSRVGQEFSTLSLDCRFR